MENTTNNSFFQKGELEVLLIGDERFNKLKPNRRERVLNVLVRNGKESIFNLKKLERAIVMDVRGF
ncbi:MAG: hypothetical protein KAI72_02110 [Candidatus Pacebacteria bacterium]|nr:hypothetical protein [Candidatus Paceibacterota bacterium]